MARKKKPVLEREIKILESQREVAWKLLRERHGDNGEDELSDDFIIWDKQLGIGSHPEDVPVKEWYFKTSAALDSIFGETNTYSRKFKRIEGNVTIDSPHFSGYQFSTWASGSLLREGIKILDKAILYKQSHVELVNQEPSDETRYANKDNKQQIKEVVMGDKYVIEGQAGAVGPGAHAQNITFSQEWNQLRGTIDLPQLADELALLRQEMKKAATGPEQDIAVGAISAAEQAAKAGNGPKTLEYLKSTGKWALDLAEKIGLEIAPILIKSILKI